MVEKRQQRQDLIDEVERVQTVEQVQARLKKEQQEREEVRAQLDKQLQERNLRRQNITLNRDEKVNVPDPLIIKQDAAVKGLKLLSGGKVLLVGLETGQIRVVDAETMQVISEQTLLTAAVLKIDQIDQAILIQYKDTKGTILICSFSKVLTVIQTLETFSTGFTQFAACLLQDESSHICIITQASEQPHMPKIWLMTEGCSDVLSYQLLDTLPTTGREEQKPTFGKFKPTSNQKPKVELPQEGTVSCLLCDNSYQDPQLLVGFESGAIGLFKLWIETVKGKVVLKFAKLFSAQKLIQDLKVKHVLSFAVASVAEAQDFKLAVGYYSSIMQTIDFTAGFEQDSFTMVDQKITDQTYHEKPGIGCLQTLKFGKRAILVSGGFDHRIKIVSLKTLKQLVLLKFHQDIVNQIQLKALSQEGSFQVFSCSEDGYVARWTLQV